MAVEVKNVYQRLLEVQKELKAPRDVDGRFGKARSAEQILENAKPVVNRHGLYLFTSDSLSQVGDRNYITATATVVNVDAPSETVSASASAWEGQVVSGLDTSQVSGKTSSYAKKYALQNLFAIDDTKDADQEHTDPTPPAKSKANVNKVSQPLIDRIIELADEANLDPAATRQRISALQNDKQAKDAIETLLSFVKPVDNLDPEPFV